MRAILITWLALATAALAAPGPVTSPRPDRKKLRSETQRFARQVIHVIDQIGEQYYRPVTPQALFEAALTGLYQAARKPVPRDLTTQVRHALNLAREMGSHPAANLQDRSDDPRELLLARAREEIGAVPSLEGQDTVLIACKAIATRLDPYSGLVTAEEQRRAIGLDHESQGTGLELKESTNPGPFEVEAVHPGSPAQRAGLRPGDRITRVNGKPADTLPPELHVALQNQRVVARPSPLIPGQGAEPAEPVRLLRLRVRRAGEEAERSVVLVRERFRTETVLGVARGGGNAWSYFVDDRSRIAHVRLTSLSRGTADDLRAVLEELRDRKARGLVFDLRWCPGGYLNEAVDAADLFLGEELISTVKMRGREDTVYRGNGRSVCVKLPMVVLVNGETSGGAELIAAALQDHGRALVVGQRTKGKASVQVPIGFLPGLVSGGLEGVGFKVTSGTFVRPSGKNLHRGADSQPDDDWGVLPDEDFRLSPELGQRLKEQWQLWSLRPVMGRERLSLDDPTYDTQRLRAVQALQRRLERKVRAKVD